MSNRSSTEEEEQYYFRQLTEACSVPGVTDSERRLMEQRRSIPANKGAVGGFHERCSPSVNNLVSEDGRGHGGSPGVGGDHAVEKLGRLNWDHEREIMMSFEEVPVQGSFDGQGSAGKWLDSRLCCFDDPREFYAHVGAQIQMDAYTLYEQMKEVYSNCEPTRNEMEEGDSGVPPRCHLDLCFEGRAVACRWKDDGMWYRAVILSSPEGERGSEKCRVKFVDYGNEVDCFCTDLRPIHTKLMRFPPLATCCFLDGCPSEVDENVKKRFAQNVCLLLNDGRGHTRCEVYVLGETEKSKGTRVFRVKLSSIRNKKKDISTDLLTLSGSPPPDPQESCGSSRIPRETMDKSQTFTSLSPSVRDSTQEACIAEINDTMGRLLLGGNMKGFLAVINKDSVYKGRKIGDITDRGLRSVLASGDMLEVKVAELRGHNRILRCTDIALKRHLDEDEFCEGYAVTTHFENDYAIAVSTVQERLVIFPESLPQNRLMQQIETFLANSDPNILKNIRLPEFSDLLFVGRTLEVLAIQMPEFIKERLKCSPGPKTACYKLALRVRPFGQVISGEAWVHQHCDNGFVIQPRDIKEMIYVPSVLFGEQRDYLKLNYPVNSVVSYKACSELPQRAYHWRAYEITLVERAETSDLFDVGGERKEEGCVGWKEETAVKVIDSGDAVEEDKKMEAEQLVKLHQDYLSSQADKSTRLQQSEAEVQEGGCSLQMGYAESVGKIHDFIGQSPPVPFSVAATGQDSTGTGETSKTGQGVSYSEAPVFAKSKSLEELMNANIQLFSLSPVTSQDSPAVEAKEKHEEPRPRSGESAESDAGKGFTSWNTETKELINFSEDSGENEEIPSSSAIVETPEAAGEAAAAVKREQMLRDIVDTGSQREKDAVKVLANNPVVFRIMFNRDP